MPANEPLEDRRVGLLLLSGPIAAGKTTLAHSLCAALQASAISTRRILTARLGSVEPESRKRLQDAGLDLEQETSGRWLADSVAERVGCEPSQRVFVIDCVRTVEQVEALRAHFGCIWHTHVLVDAETQARRYARRGDPELALKEAVDDPSEQNVTATGKLADMTVDLTVLDVDHVSGPVAAAALRAFKPCLQPL